MACVRACVRSFVRPETIPYRTLLCRIVRRYYSIRYTGDNPVPYLTMPYSTPLQYTVQQILYIMLIICKDYSYLVQVPYTVYFFIGGPPVYTVQGNVQAGLQIRAYGRIREFPRGFFSKSHGILGILNHFPPSK